VDPEDILRLLTELHYRLRNETKSQWNRSVSFQDELFDRWERAAFLGFGKGSSIYQDCLVIGDVKVGENTWIGPFTVLDGSGGLVIGCNCSISAGVQIYSHDTVRRRLSDGRIPPEREQTSIGDSCYIGPMSVISKGVTIGHHSVVGAFSLVNKDILPFSVAFGMPARVKGKVAFDEDGTPQIEWAKDDIEDIDKSVKALTARIELLEKQWNKMRGTESRKERSL